MKWWLPFAICFVIVFSTTMPNNVPKTISHPTNFQEALQALRDPYSWDGSRYIKMIETFFLALPGTGIAFAIATIMQYSLLKSQKISESIIMGNIVYILSSVSFVFVFPGIIEYWLNLRSNVYLPHIFIVAPGIPLLVGSAIVFYIHSKRLSRKYNSLQLATKP